MKNRPLQFKLEYYLTRILAGIFCLLPYSWASALGMTLGGFAYRRLKIRRKVALENLKQAFPEKSAAELDRIAYESYRHWGGVGAEYARLPRFKDKLLEKYTTLYGRDVLNEAVAGGKGGLVISGHYGNWEIMGAAASAAGYGITYIVATQANKLVDKLMDDVRRTHGIEIWKMKEAPRGTFKSLKNNRFVCIMIDQDAGRECVWVDFFGKQASTHRGASVFHLKTGSPLIMSSCVRENKCHYRVDFKQIEIPPFEGAIDEKNVFIMQFLTRLLEEQIRAHPEQYFWMHKRWKTKKK